MNSLSVSQKTTNFLSDHHKDNPEYVDLEWIIMRLYFMLTG